MQFYWAIVGDVPKVYCPVCRITIAGGPKRSVTNFTQHVECPRHVANYALWQKVSGSRPPTRGAPLLLMFIQVLQYVWCYFSMCGAVHMPSSVWIVHQRVTMLFEVVSLLADLFLLLLRLMYQVVTLV